MKYLKYVFLTAVLVFAASLALAEDVPFSLKATINKKRIFIGDKVRYKVEPPAGRAKFEFKFPEFKDHKIGDCEVKDSGNDWLEITSYYVGKRTIPSVELKFRKKGDKEWKIGKTNELTLTVESVLPKGVGLHDIRDIKPLIYPFSILKLLMQIGLGALILWILFRIIKLFIRKPPPKLPYQIAIEELDAAKKKLLSGGDTKEYYVAISDAVRRYIEKVFSLRAPEMTTQEFLMSLNDSAKLSVEYRDLLKIFMEACDLVKFAKHTPDLSEIDSVLTTAKTFVERTKEVYANI